jgi:hypothetical protein
LSAGSTGRRGEEEEEEEEEEESAVFNNAKERPASAR